MEQKIHIRGCDHLPGHASATVSSPSSPSIIYESTDSMITLIKFHPGLLDTRTVNKTNENADRPSVTILMMKAVGFFFFPRKTLHVLQYLEAAAVVHSK